jgi:hypothetical protein
MMDNKSHAYQESIYHAVTAGEALLATVFGSTNGHNDAKSLHSRGFDGCEWSLKSK